MDFRGLEDVSGDFLTLSLEDSPFKNPLLDDVDNIGACQDMSSRPYMRSKLGHLAPLPSPRGVPPTDGCASAAMPVEHHGQSIRAKAEFYAFQVALTSFYERFPAEIRQMILLELISPSLSAAERANNFTQLITEHISGKGLLVLDCTYEADLEVVTRLYLRRLRAEHLRNLDECKLWATLFDPDCGCAEARRRRRKGFRHHYPDALSQDGWEDVSSIMRDCELQLHSAANRSLDEIRVYTSACKALRFRYSHTYSSGHQGSLRHALKWLWEHHPPPSLKRYEEALRWS